MVIKYAYTILYVEDVEKTMKFYQNTFDFKVKLLTPEKDYGEIATGETTIAFAAIELGNANFTAGFQVSSKSQKPFGIELAFTTSDVDQLIKRAIENGAEILAEAVQKPWGQNVGYVRDINGFIIEICTPISMQYS